MKKKGVIEMLNFKKATGKTEVDVLQTKAPKVYINRDALTKMEIYVDSCSDEIGWLGTAYKDKDKYYIEDVMLFEQDVHGTTTEITPEGLEEFGSKLLEEEDGVEKWNKIRVWGHSHVNMGVTSSGQDDDQMETFSCNGLDWFIRIIANKRGEMEIDVYNFETGVIYKNVKYYGLLDVDEYKITKEIEKLEKELEKLQKDKRKMHKDAIDKEIKEKVRKISYGKTNKNFKVIDKEEYGYGYGYGYYSDGEYYSSNKKKEEEEDDLEIADIVHQLDDRDVEELYYAGNFTNAQDYIWGMFNYYISRDEYDVIMSFVDSVIDDVFKRLGEKEVQ